MEKSNRQNLKKLDRQGGSALKKIISYILCLITLLFSLLLSVPASAIVNSVAPTRIINVVYDDSGSMITTNNQTVDTWCQAKYAMEVFAAMLESKDTMNVYVMSDFEYDTSKGPILQLNGQDGATANVAKIHGMITAAGNTPFNSVRKAYSDVVATEADERWLVVLTDGEFQGIDNVDGFFSQKDENVRVMFLGMGPAAGGITADENRSLYYVKANDNQEILKKITDISTRIFNRDKIDIKVDDKKFSFDVPMGELIVFAQGNNVEIRNIKKEDGTTFEPSSAPVLVKYSDKPATNYPDFIVDEKLQGSIATFKGDFNDGNYTLDVANAETLEIYYKPNVEIAAYLKNSDGEEVTEMTDLAAGDYTIEFGFVKGGTGEKIGESKLLGNVKYEANVINNDIRHEKTYASGDSITIEEGDLSIDVIGHYLDYNSVSTHLDYTIFKDKEITFEILDAPIYNVKSDGFENITPMQVRVLADGKELNDKQWNDFTLPKAEFTDSHDFKMDDFIIEKSDMRGVLKVTPQLRDGKPSAGTYKDCGYTLSYTEQHGNEVWKGKSNLELKMTDGRSWIEQNIVNIIRLIILLIILMILLGYVPGIKHYLPRTLKRKPLISGMPNMPGLIPNEVKGKFEKSLASTIIPYVAQKGTIKFVPSGVAGVPKLNVKGIKGKRMSITNIKTFAGKDHITFNGESIEKGYSKRSYDTSAGITISVTVKDWTYTCQPNM